jgi:hypothetical protein
VRSICSDLKILSSLAESYKARGDTKQYERLLAIRQCYDNYTEAQMEYLIEHYRDLLLKDDPSAELDENLREVTLKARNK